ncbi:hypothetical protein [Chitinophaga pinensis]|uniref:hypothetical protein n=1 Tax=Chitinophaga pinensis TaxID=79329 RepID=UPI0011D19D37|nr:hypothetical protein [Chitinophaga pinensis]
MIDSRNDKLWKEITSKYEVIIHPSPNLEYSCNAKGETVTFYVPLSNYCMGSFTHELLHIYIRLKGVYMGPCLSRRFNGGAFLPKVFTPQLVEHVGNCLDHIKMLPLYLDMGFPREKFLLDYHEHKCTIQELNDIRTYYKYSANYYSQAVEVFIGKFLAMRADPNNGFNYESSLAELKLIDGELYRILDDLVISWQNYDLDSDDIFYTYRDIVDKLYDELQQWRADKVII